MYAVDFDNYANTLLSIVLQRFQEAFNYELMADENWNSDYMSFNEQAALLNASESASREMVHMVFAWQHECGSGA